MSAAPPMSAITAAYLHAAWCMLHYGARAIMKRLVF